MTSGTTQPTSRACGAARRSDVFAVGVVSGTILHYDGTAWKPMASGTTRPSMACGAARRATSSPSGESGTILHYDGTSWKPMTSGTTADLLDGVWGELGERRLRRRATWRHHPPLRRDELEAA